MHVEGFDSLSSKVFYKPVHVQGQAGTLCFVLRSHTLQDGLLSVLVALLSERVAPLPVHADLLPAGAGDDAESCPHKAANVAFDRMYTWSSAAVCS